MVFPGKIETERLHLERLCHENVDVLDYYRICSHHEEAIEEVTRYLPWNPHETVKETKDYIDSLERKWAEGTRAEYVIRSKEGEGDDGEIAGSAGLLCRWEKDLGVLAIWLRKPFWGRGYSGERAEALLEVAFNRLDLSVVAVPLHRDNEKSYEAVEKYVERHGGRYEGLLRNHAGRYDEPVDHHRFSISREEYRDRATDEVRSSGGR